MPRPSQAREKRKQLLPAIARAFAELGYRRTTTAELAGRCQVQENTLYRLWPDKKAMFIAAIEYVYDLSVELWTGLLAEPADGSPAERLLSYEAEHLGEFGHARIIFAGLSETDDPEIRAALARMYQRYQKFVREQLGQHRAGKKKDQEETDPALIAWAFVGLGTVASIARELNLLGERDRKRLLTHVGRLLLEGRSA